MINLRYHIVSLTAVFLALLIGILMGTTVVSKATVDGLRSNLHRAEVRSEAVHKRNGELTSELSTRTSIDGKVDDALTDQVLAQAVGGALTDAPVLVVASSGIDKNVLQRTVDALVASGADVDGTLLLTGRLAPESLDTKRLARVLDVKPSANVMKILAVRLADTFRGAALVTESSQSGRTTSVPSASTTSTVPTDPDTSVAGTSTTSTTVPPPAEPELIGALRDEGFLGFRTVDGKSGDMPVLASPHLADGIGYRYVVLSGANPNVPDSDLLSAIVARLASDGSVPLVAASAPSDDAGADRDAFLAPLLKIDGVAGNISTVDDLDSFSGSVALVYALREAASGHFGNYGVGDTASAVIPAFRTGD